MCSQWIHEGIWENVVHCKNSYYIYPAYGAFWVTDTKKRELRRIMTEKYEFVRPTMFFQTEQTVYIEQSSCIALCG